MTAVFLIACVSIIAVVSIMTFKREKKWDEENLVSDYIDGR